MAKIIQCDTRQKRKHHDRKEKYFMRADRKGDVYDREAMEKVSKQLGHNRIDVIAGHYLYTPKAA